MNRGACVVLLVAAVVSACGKNDPAPMEAPPAAAASVEPETPTVGPSEGRKALLAKMSRAVFTAYINAEGTTIQARNYQIGAKDESGKPYTVAGYLAAASKYEKEVTDAFVELIRETEHPGLRDALKSSLTAQVAFYSIATNVEAAHESSWMRRMNEARDEIRKADGALTVERKLAMAEWGIESN